MKECLQHWSLNEKPFEELRDTRFFFESQDHREALDRLLYIVHDRNMGIGILTGEIGSGKTMTRKVLERNIPKHAYSLVSMDSSGLNFNDLLCDMIRNISIEHVAFEMEFEKIHEKRGDTYYMLDTFREFVRHINEVEKRHFVAIIDEAQQLGESALDNIKNLTNLGTETKNYLTIILVGQPELREVVKGLKQLDQRVSLRFHLNNLDYINTQNYVHHRLRVAGCPREDVFTEEAISLLFRGTGGIPREINRVCKLALDHGCSSELEEIDENTVQLIIDDINRHR